MQETKQVRFCGLGGQGILLAGNLFSRAALEEWKFVCESSAYGASVTGGLCSSDVVMSQHPISYPRVIKADFLASMAQESYNQQIANVKNGSVIVYDEGVAKKDVEGVTQICIPATRLAATELKSVSAANMIILGTVVKLSGLIKKDALIKTIETNVSQRFHKLNLAAIEIAFNIPY